VAGLLISPITFGGDSRQTDDVTTITITLEMVVPVEPFAPVINSAEINDNSSKTADDLIPGKLKKSPSYHSNYGNKTQKQLESLVKQGDSKAKQMIKLIKNAPRLGKKMKGKPK
jgi:hypothetical protein